MAKISYIILLLFIPIWFLSYPPEKNHYLAVVIWWLPLLAPLKGVMKNESYTLRWSIFFLIIPLCHAIMSMLTNPTEIRWAITELILICSYYYHIYLMNRFQRKLEQRTLNK